MRIMLDTNVLLSAVIFRSKMMWNMMARIMEDHRLRLDLSRGFFLGDMGNIHSYIVTTTRKFAQIV